MKKLFLQAWILVIVLCIGFPTSVNAGPAAALDYNPRAEAWIIQQLNAGKEAGLANKFPDLADRRIRASFLVNLLDHPTKSIALYGISISDATIVGELILKYRDIDFPVLIKWSTFEGVVELCYTHFHRYLSLQGNTFKSRVDFCGLKVDDDVCLAAATFNDSLEFGSADINGNLIFDSARFSNEQSRANFGSIQVDQSLSLNNSIFEGEAIFSFAEIGVDLQLAEAQFNNEQSTADFAVIQVGHTISIPNAVFAGGVTFQSAKAGSLTANDVVFQNTEQAANFDDLRTGSIFLNRTTFNGPARFFGAQFDGHFMATEAQFLNAESQVVFENMQVKETVFLGDAVFYGPVNFSNANIGGIFSAIGTQFKGTEKEVNFESIKVGRILSLNKAVFNGPVKMIYMNIGQNLDAIGSNFNSSTGMVSLGQTRVGISIILDNAVFAGPVDARFVETGNNFEAHNAQFTNTEQGLFAENMNIGNHILINGSTFAGPVDFSLSRIGKNIGADDTRFSNNETAVDFRSMDVGKYLFLHRAVFSGPINIINTETIGFYAENMVWPQGPGMVDIRGLTYQEVNVNNAETGQGMLYLLDQSPYDARSYRALENYYLATGYPLAADEVYIHRKFRETTNGLTILAWQWWWNLFLGVFIVFGKWPEVALIWFALIVGFGYLLFRKKEKMVTVIESSKSYRPFLYSLDLFLPIIDLGYASLWKPDPDHKIIRTYAVIHRYLGLILIPVAILAVLGIIK